MRKPVISLFSVALFILAGNALAEGTMGSKAPDGEMRNKTMDSNMPATGKTMSGDSMEMEKPMEKEMMGSKDMKKPMEKDMMKDREMSDKNMGKDMQKKGM